MFSLKKEDLSLLRGSNPHAMPAVGSGVLAILTNHEQHKTKYFIIMNM